MGKVEDWWKWEKLGEKGGWHVQFHKIHTKRGMSYRNGMNEDVSVIPTPFLMIQGDVSHFPWYWPDAGPSVY